MKHLGSKMDEKALNETLIKSQKLAKKAIDSANRAIDFTKKSKNLSDYETSLNLTDHARKQLIEAAEIIQKSLLDNLK